MKHADIKQHIIKTASGLFYKNGYNLTGINEIISTAGIAKATLYSHFGSKDEVCLAYLDYKNSAFLLDIRNFCAVREGGLSQVVAIFDYLKTIHNAEDFNGCWCINAAAEVPKEKELIHAHIKQLKKHFLSYIQELILDNFILLDPKIASILARQVYLLFEGAIVDSNLHKSDWPISEAKNICFKILV